MGCLKESASAEGRPVATTSAFLRRQIAAAAACRLVPISEERQSCFYSELSSVNYGPGDEERASRWLDRGVKMNSGTDLDKGEGQGLFKITFFRILRLVFLPTNLPGNIS